MSGSRLDEAGVIAACPACRRDNRLAYGALGRPARCGQCKASIAAPAVPIDVASTRAFDAVSATSVLPLVIDFWAPWCGPCRMVAPELERVARDASGRYLVLKVNTDQLTDVAARFGIRSIPTLALVHRGRELDRLSGVRSAAEILDFAERAMANGMGRAS